MSRARAWWQAHVVGDDPYPEPSRLDMLDGLRHPDPEE